MAMACRNHDSSTSSAIKHLVECLYNEVQDYDSRKDLVTLRSIQFRVISKVLHYFNMNWNQIQDLISNHVIIHDQVGDQLIALSEKLSDHYVCMLSQDFVKKEKVQKLFRKLYNSDPNLIDGLCAVDGIVARNNNGAVWDYKSYFENLRYALQGNNGPFDGTPEHELKRIHVQAIRNVYDIFHKKYGNQVKLSHLVNRMMVEILKEVDEEIVLSVDTNPAVTIDQTHWNDTKAMYYAHVGEDNIKKLLEVINLKNGKVKKSKKRKLNNSEPVTTTTVVNVDNESEDDEEEDEE